MMLYENGELLGDCVLDFEGRLCFYSESFCPSMIDDADYSLFTKEGERMTIWITSADIEHTTPQGRKAIITYIQAPPSYDNYEGPKTLQGLLTQLEDLKKENKALKNAATRNPNESSTDQPYSVEIPTFFYEDPRFRLHYPDGTVKEAILTTPNCDPNITCILVTGSYSSVWLETSDYEDALTLFGFPLRK